MQEWCRLHANSNAQPERLHANSNAQPEKVHQNVAPESPLLSQLEAATAEIARLAQRARDIEIQRERERERERERTIGGTRCGPETGK